MKLNTILRGDSLEVLRTLPDASIDMVFTDPPYGHNNNNGDLISRREQALGWNNCETALRGGRLGVAAGA